MILALRRNKGCGRKMLGIGQPLPTLIVFFKKRIKNNHKIIIIICFYYQFKKKLTNIQNHVKYIYRL